MRLLLATVATLVCLSASSLAEDAASVSLTATPTKPEYVLGEPVMVTIAITNHSAEIVVYESMNPYAVTITDASGKACYDPSLHTMYSGIFPRTQIPPGETREFSIDLNAYFQAAEAGAYRVHLGIKSHRGWPSVPAPIDFKVQLRAPSAEEAAGVIAQLQKERRGFNSIRSPIYIESLKRLAASGNTNAFDGLSQIPSVEATHAMLDILAATTRDQERKSEFGAFAARLPTQAVGSHGWGNSRLPGVDIETLWDAATRSQLLDLGHAWLRQPASQQPAVQILGAVGTAADAASLQALALQALRADDGKAFDPWHPSETVSPGAVIGALSAMQKRQVWLPGDPAVDPVAACLWFDKVHATAKTDRPPEWAGLVRQWFASPFPALRTAAVASIPYPPPAEFSALLAQAKNDSSENVQRAALFASEHKIQISTSSPFGPRTLPFTLKLENGKITNTDPDWQVNFYSSVIAHDPKNADAYDNRGVAHFQNKQFDEALQDFQSAIDLRPSLGAAFNNRGLVYAARGRRPKAIADYSHALELDPNMSEAHFNRGLCYAANREFDEALKDFNAVISMDIEYGPAYGQRAALEKSLGKPKEAEADETHADALDPKWRTIDGRPRIQAGRSSPN